MPEAEKNLAKQIQETAASIPAPLRAAALEKANTYLSGMADMAAMVAPEKKEEAPHE